MPRQPWGVPHILGLTLLCSVLPVHAGREIFLLEVLGQALQANVDTLLREQQVIDAEGRVLQTRGQFDPVLVAGADHARNLRPLRADEVNQLRLSGTDPVTRQIQQASTWRLGTEKTFLNGVSAGTAFSLSSTKDTLLTGVPNQLAGTLTFTLTIPMARNAGRETAGAELEARQIELEAVRAELRQGQAQTLLDTTLAYWDWVANEHRLTIAVAAEHRLNDLVSEMKRLIDTGQTPRADIELALASRAEKAALRLTAEQAVEESHRKLARLMGLPAGRVRELSRPANDFPPYREWPAHLNPAHLIEQALANSAELEAARLRNQAGRYRLTAARNNLKPQVDLGLSLGYTGLAEGLSAWRADRSLDNAIGPSVGATLTLQWPWENNTAQGVLRSTAASLDSAILRERDLEQSIATHLPVRLEALRRAALQRLEGAEAVKHYEMTLINEQTKRRLGTATVIDVINVEDRLNNALLNDVALRQNHAAAIAELRFECGWLVQRRGEAFQVTAGPLLGGHVFEE